MLTIRSTVDKIQKGLSAAAICGIVMLSPALSHAHFKLNDPPSWMSQGMNGNPQKNGPCGATPGSAEPQTPGTPTLLVTSYQAGQTIPVTVVATIGHPGWYRIALVKGQSSAQTLATLPDPDGATCAPTQMMNPVWSPTQPVIADGLPTGSKTFQVKLPADVTCTSADPCTLQVIMVMTDGAPGSCYYHHCADITNDATSPYGGAISDAGASSMGGGDSSSGATQATSDSGCSCAIPDRRSSNVSALGGLLGLAALLRRRRRA